MSALATLAATGVSLAALGWIGVTDPKRRRTFGLKPAERTAPRWAWAVALVPGVIVPFWSGAAGFVLWFGALSVAGWALVAVPPHRFARLGQRLDGLGTVFEAAVHRIGAGRDRIRAAVARRRHATHREAPLAARVAALEAEVAALRALVSPAQIRLLPDDSRVEDDVSEGFRLAPRRSGSA